MTHELPTELHPFRSDPHRTAASSQACLRRIGADVLNRMPQVLLVANDAVVALFLPQVSGLLQMSIDLSRAQVFQLIQLALRQGVFQAESDKVGCAVLPPVR